MYASHLLLTISVGNMQMRDLITKAYEEHDEEDGEGATAGGAAGRASAKDALVRCKVSRGGWGVGLVLAKDAFMRCKQRSAGGWEVFGEHGEEEGEGAAAGGVAGRALAKDVSVRCKVRFEVVGGGWKVIKTR